MICHMLNYFQTHKQPNSTTQVLNVKINKLAIIFSLYFYYIHNLFILFLVYSWTFNFIFSIFINYKVINISTIVDHGHSNSESEIQSYTVQQLQHIMICSDICVISGRRERLVDEIIPASVAHSQTFNNDEEKYAAAHAIDLDLDTVSATMAGSDGRMWLKVKLGKLICIEQVIWYRSDGSPRQIHTCSSTDCTDCTHSSCDSFSLTVSIEGTSTDDLPPTIPDCKYGDTVKLEKISGSSFVVYEIAITGKQGEICNWEMR